MTRMMRFLPALFALILILLASPVLAADYFVFFGTHNVGAGKGFSLSHFDSDTGVLTPPQFLQESPSPGYFVLSSDGKFLYTCNSTDPKFKDQGGGGISAYTIDPKTAHLTLLNSKPSGGDDPSFISLDKANKHAFVANYQSGTISAWSINPDGSFGERTALIQHTGSSINPSRQKHPYAHSIRLDPSQKFCLVCDLGVDKVFVYRFDAKDGSLKPNDPPFAAIKPGSGPRHFYFHPNGKWVYVITEMASTIVQFNWDADHGTLTEVKTVSSLPPDFKGTSTAAEIEVHPNGKFLFSSNRGDNSITVFSIDQTSGALSQIDRVPSGGVTPRNFEIDPSGHWLLVTNHGMPTPDAQVFKIDQDTGKLTAQGEPIPVIYPFCERFLAAP
jgi:6-phosphogluconolactonase